MQIACMKRALQDIAFNRIILSSFTARVRDPKGLLSYSRVMLSGGDLSPQRTTPTTKAFVLPQSCSAESDLLLRISSVFVHRKSYFIL